jgi:tRNA/rRNA methyltransferase
VNEARFRVILLEPETGGNIGAVARSMKNFRLNDLWIVNPKTSINDEAKRFAMGGLNVLKSARVVDTFKEALKGVDLVVGTSSVAATSTSNLYRVSIKPSDLAQKVQGAEGVIALVFGRESTGLSNREVEECDFMVTIPANRQYNVLNIATAASIIFYEIFNQRRTRQDFELASRPTMERLLIQFDALVSLSQVASHKQKFADRAFRNVISRSLVSKREASLILGVFRKLLTELT